MAVLHETWKFLGDSRILFFNRYLFPDCYGHSKFCKNNNKNKAPVLLSLRFGRSCSGRGRTVNNQNYGVREVLLNVEKTNKAR